MLLLLPKDLPLIRRIEILIIFKNNKNYTSSFVAESGSPTAVEEGVPFVSRNCGAPPKFVATIRSDGPRSVDPGAVAGSVEARGEHCTLVVAGDVPSKLYFTGGGVFNRSSSHGSSSKFWF